MVNIQDHVVLHSHKGHPIYDGLDKTVARHVALLKIEYNFVKDYFYLPISRNRFIGCICSILPTLVITLVNLVFLLTFPIMYGKEVLNCYFEEKVEMEDSHENQDFGIATKKLIDTMTWDGKTTLNFDQIFIGLYEQDENYFDDSNVLDEEII